MADLPIGVIINATAWLAWSLLVGFVGHRWPDASLRRDYWWSHLHRAELGKGWYVTLLRIHRWKDRLPELGGLFAGGFAKRGGSRTDRAHVERFIVATRRAEAVHWLVFWLWPVFAGWNPPWAVALMAGYAALANLPCLLVQRYNRGRLISLRRRWERRAARRRATGALPRGRTNRRPEAVDALETTTEM